MAVCPSCGSSRVRRGYQPVPFPLRMLGIRELLCDNCNYLYRAFSPLPPKSHHRRHTERRTEPSLASHPPALDTLDKDNLHKLDKEAPIHGKSPLYQARPPLLIDLPPAVDPAADARAHFRHNARICPQCGSDQTKRRRRRLWERAVFAFSDKRPYTCLSCDASFYDRQHPKH